MLDFLDNFGCVVSFRISTGEDGILVDCVLGTSSVFSVTSLCPCLSLFPSFTGHCE
jgi:hypothetical protein